MHLSLIIRCWYINTRVQLDSGPLARTNHLINYTMLTDLKAFLLGSLLLFPFILYRIHRAKQVWRAFGNVPARSLLFSPLNTFSLFLPRIPWISDGQAFSWEDVYERQPVPMSAFLSI